MANAVDREGIELEVNELGQPKNKDVSLGSGKSFITRVERLICGRAVTFDLPHASGLSKMGVRTSCILSEPAEIESVPEQTSEGLVIHIPFDEEYFGILADRDLFVADSHQQIVDLTFHAHRISESSGRPIFLMTGNGLLEKLGWATVPKSSEVESLLKGKTADEGSDDDHVDIEPIFEPQIELPGKIVVRDFSEGSLEGSLLFDALAAFKHLPVGREIQVEILGGELLISTPEKSNTELCIISESVTPYGRACPGKTEMDDFLLVYLNSEPDSLSVWRSFRKRFGRTNLPQNCTFLSASTSGLQNSWEDSRFFWIGSLLNALVEASGLASTRIDIEPLETWLKWKHFPNSAEALMKGLAESERLDVTTLESSIIDDPFGIQIDRENPLLPKPDAEMEKAAQWKSVCWNFHVTGDPGDLNLSNSVRSSLPAAVIDLPESTPDSYPYFLPDPVADDSAPCPLIRLIDEIMQDAEKGGTGFPVLRTSLKTLVRWASEEFVNAGEGQDLQPIWRKTLDRLRENFDVSIHGQASLEKEIEKLADLLPPSGRLVEFGSLAPLEFFSWAAYRERLPLRKQYFEKAKELSERLNEILLADELKSPGAKSPDALSQSLGEWGDDWVDSKALSSMLPKVSGSQGLSEESRDRIKRIRESLTRFLSFIRETPAFFLISADNEMKAVGGTTLINPNPFEYAAGITDGILMSVVDGIRAVRAAEFELDGRTTQDALDAFLAHFEWQSLSSGELLLLPPILVLESSDRLSSTSLASLHRLLRSTRPVSVFITIPDSFVAGDEMDSALSGLIPDYGYLGMANREVLVLQSSPSEAEHLLSGLRRLVQNLRPGIAVIAEPSPDLPSRYSWYIQKLANKSRTFPCFLYDPSLGNSWADRFTLAGNDAIEDRLLFFEIQAETGKREFTSVKEGITFAQVAALNPRYADHFLVIPPEAWDDNQVEMAEYLEEFATSIPKAVPFIWLINPEKELCRAIVSREMSSACYDRLLSWQNLQELGGLNNEYVQRAVSKVRKEMEDEIAQREKDVEERARKAGAESAIDRLVALFSDPSALPAVTRTEAQPPPKELPEDEKPEVETQETDIIEITEEPETGEEELPEDPYIDSFLCSSCNDCINLNPLMFKYNGDNQAYIADPSAGTFLQLVKAAEGCPAKCIHPGTPQPGDETATPEVLGRAKALM